MAPEDASAAAGALAIGTAAKAGVATATDHDDTELSRAATSNRGQPAPPARRRRPARVLVVWEVVSQGDLTYEVWVGERAQPDLTP
jgi:hypothetical protein